MHTTQENNDLNYIWSNHPLKNYYNLNGLQDVILTCDIDWAPDFAIEYVLNIIESVGCNITMFSTHRSKLLLSAPEFCEIGLHPDFTRPRNTQTPLEKFIELKEIYPEAVGTRSHRNFFGQNIADAAHECGLIYDVSNFLWNESFCQAHIDYNKMVRFSYMWEDGIHLDTETKFEWEKINIHTPGLKIINIHPILIYLNSVKEEHRRSVTRKYTDLTKAKKSDIDLEVNHGYGIKDFWLHLLRFINDQQIRTHKLSDIARLYQGNG